MTAAGDSWRDLVVVARCYSRCAFPRVKAERACARSSSGPAKPRSCIRRARWCRVIIALIDIRSLLADRASEKEVVREKSGERGRSRGGLRATSVDLARRRRGAEKRKRRVRAGSGRPRCGAARRGDYRAAMRDVATVRDLVAAPTSRNGAR